jgi:parallel beta-helix repeat protein
MSGVAIWNGGVAELKNNTIQENGEFALHIHSGGRGKFFENDLRENGRGPISITRDCELRVEMKKNLT